MVGRSASAAGMARNTAQYFQSASSGGSAHYIVDAGKDEQHCVRDNTIAWHAPPNSFSIGIEICAESTYSSVDWESDDVWPAVVLAAQRAAELCHRLGVPVARVTADDLKRGKRGICSHKDVADAWKQSDHWDPGTGFPWDKFMELCQGGSSTSLPGLEDDMKPTDVTGEIEVAPGAFYQLTRDGGIRVVDGAGQPKNAVPFYNYTAVASDGARYSFGPNKNGGAFNYPGLPVEARQGERYFVAIVKD